ncbi:MAG: hypothetical protein ACFBZ8_05745 [Opitutales bacterium]
MGPVAFRKHITYPGSVDPTVAGPRPVRLPNLRQRLERYRAQRADQDLPQPPKR